MTHYCKEPHYLQINFYFAWIALWIFCPSVQTFGLVNEMLLHLWYDEIISYEI